VPAYTRKGVFQGDGQLAEKGKDDAEKCPPVSVLESELLFIGGIGACTIPLHRRLLAVDGTSVIWTRSTFWEQKRERPQMMPEKDGTRLVAPII